MHFARALGLSHTGKTEAARIEVQKLASLRDTLAGINDKYWADQVEIQRESTEAWITLAEGKSEGALRLMRSAADHEDQTDKNNVTPGVILPAREMLGDMLLEMKQPARGDGRIREYATHRPESLQLAVRRGTRSQAVGR